MAINAVIEQAMVGAIRSFMKRARVRSIKLRDSCTNNCLQPNAVTSYANFTCNEKRFIIINYEDYYINNVRQRAIQMTASASNRMPVMPLLYIMIYNLLQLNILPAFMTAAPSLNLNTRHDHQALE